MDKPKLEACPFCGGEATLKWLSGTGWMVRCSKCSGRVMDNDGEYAAVQAWNRRTPLENKALTERDTAMVCSIRTTNRGIDVSGEYDIDSDFICPSCGFVVGDAEENELHGTFCDNCGQRLSVPAEED